MEDTETEEPLTGGKRFLQFFKNYWKSLVVFITPLVFLPIFLFNNTPAYRCLYLVCVMAVYWVTEALPLAITSLIPVFAFPMMSIMDTNSTCKNYFKATVMMFFGGLVLAQAIEYSNLHKRVALWFVILIGCSLKRLYFGLMIITTFASLWISNTAATAMMIPVIFAVFDELQKEGLCQLFDREIETQKEPSLKEQEKPVPSKVAVGFFTGLAYSSTLGGIGTLIGTGTNLTFMGIYETRFPESPGGIDFLKFSFYAFPLMVLQSFLIHIWLAVFYFGLFRPNSKAAKAIAVGKEGEELAHNVIKTRYNELGSMTSHEIGVAILFLICVILLFTRDPGFITGWAKMISTVKISDDTVMIFIVILFFVFPAKWSCLNFCKRNSNVPRHHSEGLITWAYINAKTKWGLIFLLGGGFALAEGGQISGMAKLIGNSLRGIEIFDKYFILFLVILFCKFSTELSSNVAIANIVLPVLAEMAIAIKIHPLYLMLPAALTCSMAFHLPVGTPPNALISGVSYIPTQDMAIAGIGPSIITTATIWFWAISWGRLVYPDSNSFPEWAANSTSFNGSRYNLVIN